ncbi:MAG: gamma-glutamylcyclotransferase family protein [Myxococcota bacterium]
MSALFVYGSLRTGAGHPMHERLQNGARDAIDARVRGRLFAVDWYPGLVLDDEAGWVVGQLWRDVDSALWPVLDAYEACGLDDPLPHEYVRTTTAITTVAGVVEAWVYAYVLPVANLQPVISGDWLAR